MSNLKQSKEDLDGVLHWRGKHAQAIRERDALQQRLTAADERVDITDGLLLAWYEANAKGLIHVHDAAYHIVTSTAEALEGGAAPNNANLDQVRAMAERVDVLEELLREVQKSARKQDWASGYPTLFASVDAALKPADGPSPTTCTWSEGGFSWRTGCGKEWQFTDGGLPIENGMKFCHSCGKTLVVEGGGDEH